VTLTNLTSVVTLEVKNASQLTAEDIISLNAIHTHDSSQTSRFVWEDVKRKPKDLYFFAVSSEEPGEPGRTKSFRVALLVMSLNEVERFYRIKDFVTLAAWRKRGYGSWLLMEAVAYVRDMPQVRHIEYIFRRQLAYQHVEKIYTRAGFVQVKEIDNGSPQWLYQLSFDG